MKADLSQVQVRVVPIDSVKEMPGNPRKITKIELKALGRSVKKFGMPQPLIVYASKDGHRGEIIGGHQRWKAAKRIGWTEVPVIFWRGTYGEARALNVALNKIGGDWDMDRLADFMASIEKEAVSLKVTGFTSEELEAITTEIGAYTPKLAPGTIKDVDLSKIGVEPKTRSSSGTGSKNGKLVRCPHCGKKL